MTAPRPPNALGLRHVRLGFWGLAVFVTLGVLLEALHGFKVGFYLEVANEPRRLAWRLAHAHGTLLSLLNVVFGLTLDSRFTPEASRSARASRLLVLATVLVPAGFFLGGFFIAGGDPGLGVLLVPGGAVALLLAVLTVARGIPPSAHDDSGSKGPEALELREIRYDSSDYDASVVLRSRVLREPLGLRPGPDERPQEAALRHLGAFEDGVLVACLMLQDLGEG
ncbi:MAG TPA: hypothetical protein VGQ57_00655, partial [Polyangiaceae bacterium]|nr:hypothetical protein [Polyangiaceae bacterium]